MSSQMLPSAQSILVSTAAGALQREMPPIHTATGFTSKMKISDELMNPLPWSTDTLDPNPRITDCV